MKNLFITIIMLTLLACSTKDTRTQEEINDSIMVVNYAVKDSTSSHIPLDTIK